MLIVPIVITNDPCLSIVCVCMHSYVSICVEACSHVAKIPKNAIQPYGNHHFQANGVSPVFLLLQLDDKIVAFFLFCEYLANYEIEQTLHLQLGRNSHICHRMWHYECCTS